MVVVVAEERTETRHSLGDELRPQQPDPTEQVVDPRGRQVI